MNRFFKLAFLLLVIGNFYSSHAQGLRFLNPIDSINGRTSYSVFADDKKVFAHKLNIKFDLQIPRVGEVGYILHLVDENKGVNFNLFYDGRGNDWFELNEEGKTTLIRSNFNRKEFLDKGWVTFSLCFDLEQKEVALTINGRTMKAVVSSLPSFLSPKIVFGRFDYLIEVPSVTIRNLYVQGGEVDYFFPLSQSRSNDVFDNQLNKVGHVDNPYWSINDCYHWKKLDIMHFLHNAGTCFDPKRHLLYGDPQGQRSRPRDDLRRRQRSFLPQLSPGNRSPKCGRGAERAHFGIERSWQILPNHHLINFVFRHFEVVRRLFDRVFARKPLRLVGRDALGDAHVDL